MNIILRCELLYKLNYTLSRPAAVALKALGGQPKYYIGCYGCGCAKRANYPGDEANDACARSCINGKSGRTKNWPAIGVLAREPTAERDEAIVQPTSRPDLKDALTWKEGYIEDVEC